MEIAPFAGYYFFLPFCMFLSRICWLLYLFALFYPPLKDFLFFIFFCPCLVPFRRTVSIARPRLAAGCWLFFSFCTKMMDVAAYCLLWGCRMWWEALAGVYPSLAFCWGVYVLPADDAVLLVIIRLCYLLFIHLLLMPLVCYSVTRKHISQS